MGERPKQKKKQTTECRATPTIHEGSDEHFMLILGRGFFFSRFYTVLSLLNLEFEEHIHQNQTFAVEIHCSINHPLHLFE